MALALALVGLLVIVAGRLVYPVFGIRVSEGAAALLVSTLFGAIHASLLALGSAMLALAMSMRGAAPRAVIL